MANINITTEELKKILRGTGMNKRHFLAKLSSIKMDDYKSEKKKHEAKREKASVA